MNDADERPFTASALLKTMAVSALLASAVSACNQSLDKPVLPQAPKPQTAAPGPAEITHAIFSTQPGAAVFYRDGATSRSGRLVIRT
jgi:hypothetical protein